MRNRVPLSVRWTGAVVLIAAVSVVAGRGDPAKAAVDGLGPGAQLRLAPDEPAVWPHREEDVVFSSGPVRLAGSLLLPTGAGTHPAIVMTQGAGHETRESNRKLASHFARQGLAALVYDKRGAGQSGGRYNDLAPDFRALAEDALAAVRFLQAHPEIDRRRIGIWGISEGGIVGPLAASTSGDVAFVIAVSAPGIDVSQPPYWMGENYWRHAGLPPKAVRFSLRGFKLVWDTTRVASARRHPRRFDAAEIWTRVRQPSLLVYGELDRKVPPALSARRIGDALARAGNPDYSIVSFAQADHGIVVSRDGFTEDAPARYAPGYPEVMLSWIEARLPGRPLQGGPVWRPAEVESVGTLSLHPRTDTPLPRLAAWLTLLGTFLVTSLTALFTRLTRRLRKRAARSGARPRSEPDAGPSSSACST